MQSCEDIRLLCGAAIPFPVFSTHDRDANFSGESIAMCCLKHYISNGVRFWRRSFCLFLGFF